MELPPQIHHLSKNTVETAGSTTTKADSSPECKIAKNFHGYMNNENLYTLLTLFYAIISNQSQQDDG